ATRESQVLSTRNVEARDPSHHAADDVVVEVFVGQQAQHHLARSLAGTCLALKRVCLLGRRSSDVRGRGGLTSEVVFQPRRRPSQEPLTNAVGGESLLDLATKFLRLLPPLLQVRVDWLPVPEVVGDDGVYIWQLQRRELQDNLFRRAALVERADDGVQR